MTNLKLTARGIISELELSIKEFEKNIIKMRKFFVLNEENALEFIKSCKKTVELLQEFKKDVSKW